MQPRQTNGGKEQSAVEKQETTGTISNIFHYRAARSRHLNSKTCESCTVGNQKEKRVIRHVELMLNVG